MCMYHVFGPFWDKCEVIDAWSSLPLSWERRMARDGKGRFARGRNGNEGRAATGTEHNHGLCALVVVAVLLLRGLVLHLRTLYACAAIWCNLILDGRSSCYLVVA